MKDFKDWPHYVKSRPVKAWQLETPGQVTHGDGSISQGEPGDFIVAHDPPDVLLNVTDFWIVKKEVFEKSYDLANPKAKSAPVLDPKPEKSGDFLKSSRRRRKSRSGR